MENLIPLVVALPLLGAALLVGIQVFTSWRALADLLALALAAITTALCVVLFLATRSETLVYWFGGWPPRQGIALGICFAVDPAGALMAGLAGVLVTASLLYSWHYFETLGTYYHSLMMLLLASLIGFSLTGDLFNLFVFFELSGVAAYALTGYKIEEAGPIQGGLNFLVMNSIAAFFFLSGIAHLYAKTGALNMAQIAETLAGHRPDVSVEVSLGLLFIGFLVRAAVVPFHFWLADAQAVAPAPVCVLLSGILVGLGLFAIIRVYGAVFRPVLDPLEPYIRNLLVALGALTAVLGGVMCVLQRHLERLLAFATVSNGGFILAAFLVPGATAGALMYGIGYGLIIGALFMGVGILLHRFNSVDGPQLHGAGRSLPGLAVLFFVAGLGLSGMPPFAPFMGKAMLVAGAPSAYAAVLLGIAVVASVLTGSAVLRTALSIFLACGKPAPFVKSAPSRGLEERETDFTPHQRIPWVMWVPAVLLLALALFVALAPNMVPRLQDAGARLYRPHAVTTVLLAEQETFPPEPAFHPKANAWGAALGLTVAALALAWASTQVYRLPERLRNLPNPLSFLRWLHSGYIGDYVTWFMVGAAALLVALAAPGRRL